MFARLRNRANKSGGRATRRQLRSRIRHNRGRLSFEPLEDRRLLSLSLFGVPDWVEQGPGPTTGGQVNLGGGNPVSGAIEAVAPHPTDANTIYVAAVNGGVWRTTNGGANWTPLTDQLPSLSGADIAFSPLDATNQTLFFGVGNYSSGFGTGGPLSGLWRTIDGGGSWQQLDAANLVNERLREVIPTSIGTSLADQVVLVASRTTGLFRSTDGGDNFTLISGTPATGDGLDNNGDGVVDEAGELNLPAGAVIHLGADPGNANRFYTAITGVGVFRSDNGGANWVATNNAALAGVAGTSRIEVSVSAAAGNPVYAALITGGALSNVFRSPDQGATWTPIGVAPNIHPGPQGNTHFSMLASATNANQVFVAGDRATGSPFVANAFLGDAGTNTWTSTVNNLFGGFIGAPHADSRDMAYDANGDIIEVNDGGVVRLNLGVISSWSSLNGDIHPTEFYSVALDTDNNTVFGGTQDTGSTEQSSAGSLTWNEVASQNGDGGTADVISAPGVSVHFTMGNNLTDFVQRIFIGGAFFGEFSIPLNGLVGADTGIGGLVITDYKINVANASRMVLGENNLYESFDQGNNLTQLNVGGATGVTAVAAGGRSGGSNNAEVVYAGVGGNLYMRSTATANLPQLAAYTVNGGGAPLGIGLHPEDWQTAYVTDGANVYQTTNAGTAWNTITGNLAALTGRLQKVEVFSPTGTPGDEVVLVVGQAGVFRTRNPEAGADALWTEYGGGLPNAVGQDVRYYDGASDTLLAGTFGRGAWTVPNASDTLDVPGVLQIDGDTDFPGQDDVIKLLLDPNNPSLLDVFLNSTTPTDTFQLSTLEQINVNGLGGNDTLIVDHTNSLVNVPNGIRYDGGVGFDLLQVIGLEGFDVTYDIGPGNGQGVLTQSDGTDDATIFFTGLEPVEYRGGGAGTTLTINAPASGNDINYTEGPNSLDAGHAVFGGDTTGYVTVDTFESTEFSNFEALVINAGAGDDTTNLNNPETPTALTDITVNGDDDTVGDMLIVNGVAAATTINTLASTIAGASGAGGAVSITYGTIEGLTVVAGGSNELAVTNSSDYTVNPGAATDDGTILTNSIPIIFKGFGSGDTLDLSGSDDLVINGTGVNDAFTVAATSGDVTIAGRATIERSGTLSDLFLNALDGDDVFNVTGPQPYTTINLAGGNPSASDQLNLTGNGTAMTMSVGDASPSVTGGGLGTVNLSGIEIANINSAAGNLTVQTTGDNDVVEVTPQGPNDGTLQANGVSPVVNFATTATFSVNLLGGSGDALTVNGSAGADVIAASGLAVGITGKKTINYSNAEALAVNGLAGSDTFNVTPASIPIFTDGGDPIGTTPGDMLHILGGGDPVTFNPGPESDEGSFDVGANQPVSFDHMESFTISGGGPLVVNGTNGPDAITVIARDDSTHAGTDGEQDFTVSVNASPDFLFLDVAAVTINALSGSDEVVLRTPAPNNANWNTDVTVNGGPPSASDRLVVETPGGAAETAKYTPNAVDGGMLVVAESDVAKATDIVINEIEELVYDGEVDDDTLTILATSGDDSILHTPGITDDSGRFQVNNLLALSYQSLGGGATLIAEGGGGSDILVYHGTAAGDTFFIDVHVFGGQVELNNRLAVLTSDIQTLTVEGFAGDDEFTLVPPISDSPYDTINVNAGDEASGTGDRLNLLGTDGDDQISLSGQTIVLGGITVNGTGVEDIRLDAQGGTDQITYNGVVGVSEDIELNAAPVANSGELLVEGVASYNFSNAELFDVHGNDGAAGDTDTLTFAGTNNRDLFEITLDAAGDSSDPVLQLLDESGTTTQLTLLNYTQFTTLNIKGRDEADVFNVYTGSALGRQISIDGGLPAGKRRKRPADATDVLNVFWAKEPRRPSITHNAETQNQNSGLIDLVYANGTRSVIQYDNMEKINIERG